MIMGSPGRRAIDFAMNDIHSKFSLATACLLALVVLVSCALQPQQEPAREQARVDYDILLRLPAEPVAYGERVKPILERRCVVCHGCYDAPCQLKLSSPEGVARGASKQKVYDGARILAMQPTRLFMDASTPEQWRAKGFHPVLNEGPPAPEANLDQSVMYRMLRLKQRHPQPRVGMLPDSFDLGLERTQECPSAAEFDTYARRHPQWGMPYAMPNLADDEYAALVSWLAQGASMPQAPSPSNTAGPQIERWERFLNGTSDKERLVGRTTRNSSASTACAEPTRNSGALPTGSMTSVPGSSRCCQGCST